MKERHLYPKVSELFSEGYHLIYEYRLPDNSNREIDILCVSKNKCNPELIAIETKISDWKNVIRQAFIRLFYVDKSYIALPQKYAEKVEKERLLRHGIGLISVDGYAKILVDAKNSDKTLKWRREMLLNDIRNKLDYD